MKETLSVSNLLTIIKDTIALDDRLKQVLVQGELSNFNLHRYGHAYFSLKDERSKISAVMFKGNFNTVKFKPVDGMQVLVSAYVNIYEAGGQLQINVISMQELGLGDLYRDFELLKNKLQAEGLFERSHKKILTPYPEKVAIIAALNSAAAADINTNFKRRWPLALVHYYYCNMQGKAAAKEIIEMLQVIDNDTYDAIIIARGGGSFEDLNCFNDELLVRTIYALNTPVVSGIGHEVDSTLTDYVADIRAATPTAAVEIITPDYLEELVKLENYREFFNNWLLNSLNKEKLSLKMLKQHLDNNIHTLRKKLTDFQLLALNFAKLSDGFVASHQQNLLSYRHSLQTSVAKQLKNQQVKFINVSQLLPAYNPLNILQRGYAIISKGPQVVTSISDVEVAEQVEIRLSDGCLVSRVEDKTNGKKV